MLIKDTYQPKLFTKKIKDQIYEQIKNAIVEGELPEGYLFKDTDIATEFNVSRMPARDALQRLEVEGFIKQTPMKGYQIVSLSNQDVAYIFSIRKSLEGLAAEYSCKHCSENEIAELKAIVLECHKLFDDKPKDFEEQFVALTREFNVMFINSCRVYRLIHLILGQYEFLLRFNVVAKVLRKRGKKVIEDRDMILDALIKRDSKRARQVWEEHLHKAMIAYFEYVGEDIESVDYI